MSEVFAFTLNNCSSVGYILGICFTIQRYQYDEYIVKLRRGIVKYVYEVIPLRFVNVRHKIPRNNIKINRYELNTFYVDIACLQISMRKLKLCITQSKLNTYTSRISCCQNNLALTEIRNYIFDSLLRHQLTKDITFVFIRTCGNEVYKVEKLKDDTCT